MKGSLKTITASYKDDAVSIMRLSCTVISIKVLTRTPVLDGHLRASWTVSNGAPRARNVVISTGAAAETLVRNEITSVINSLMPGDTYSFANGQPYARRVEYDGWSHTKRPEGMLRVSVAEWDNIVGGVMT